jgi:thiosulfate/3-mercaptopyruvate sulfurtransferase
MHDAAPDPSLRTTLVEPAELASHLHDPDWVVLDCRFELARPRWGAQAFAEGHVPGAQYADLDADLSGPITPTSGRHPLPDRSAFARRAAAWGIDERVQVVVYDQANAVYASRAWWLLRSAGHRAVAVLNGGFAGWLRAGQPVTAAVAARTPRVFTPRWQEGASVDIVELQQLMSARAILLVDARAADRFAGQNETIDPIAGHVPGAVNHPVGTNVDADGRLLPPEDLRQRWLATLDGWAPAQLVAMCGSGVSACQDLLALEHAGLAGARLYPGSWSEWIRDPARPVATGSGDTRA